jgi:hypothetical protein
MLRRVATVNSGFVSQGLLIQLRSHHPSGCLLSELLQVVDGNYVVRATIAVDGLTIATALAADPTIERAEDQARSRLMAVIGLTPLNLSEPKFEPVAVRIPDVIVDVLPAAVVAPMVEPERLIDPLEVVADDTEMSPDDLAKVGAKSTKSKAKSPKAKSKLEDVPSPEPMVEITGGTDADDDMAIEYEFTIEGDDEPDAVMVMDPMPSEPTIDLSDAIAQIGAEIERIGWTKKQGSSYLQEAYSKRTRAELTETELLSFLQYLKALPAKIAPALSDLPF